VVRRRFGSGDGPTVALVAGVRGDTPEGTRILHEVGKHLFRAAERLTGTVHVYPCVNPLAADQGVRHWPGLDVDLARRFPGRPDGHAPDRLADTLLTELRAADVVVELRAAHPAFRQVPQARVRADAGRAVELAAAANVRCLKKQSSPPAAGSLEEALPGLVMLEGGSGNRLTDEVGLELTDGVLNVLTIVGVFPEADLPFHWAAIQRPLPCEDADIVDARAARGGLFLPAVSPWSEVEAGAPLGEIIDPMTGETRETILAPASGRVLAHRAEPVVYPGNLVARLVRQ
jgi:predicted deacylase